MAKINEYIDIAAYKNTLKCVNKDLFTSGNIRVNKLRISLDSWWDNLPKWFCFRVKDNVCYADEVEKIGSDIIVTIPSGIFIKENVGNTCFFGIYGSEGEEPNVALSTEWYNLGKIEEGVYATNTLIAEADSFLAAVDAKINSAAQLAVNSAELSIDEDYVLTLTAKNEKGEILSSSFVDLPIEELVKDGRYDEENKEIVLILEDGKEIRVPVGDLVENKLDKITTGTTLKLYSHTGEKQGEIEATTSFHGGTIPLRDGRGNLQTKTVVEDNDVTTKTYVDTAVGAKLDANGLSTESQATWGGWSNENTNTTKVKRNSKTILNFNTDNRIEGYSSENGWHISPNVINSSKSFSDTDATVYLKTTSQEGIVGVNTTKDLPSGEVAMGATFDGQGLHLDNGLTNKVATLDITRDSVKRNDATETWEKILSAPSKLDDKISKTSEKNKLYGTQENGYQWLYDVSKNADSHSVAQRTEFGTIKAEHPRDDNDVATQGSVNTGLSKKLNRVNKESDYLSVYAVTDSGGDAFLKQRSDEAPAWSVPLRFRQGQILAARSDIEKDPEKLKDSKGNPIDTDNFLITQGQLKEVDAKVNNRLQKTNSTYVLYGTTGKDSAGNTTQSELPFRTTVSNNSIAQRTGTGQLKAAEGIESEDVVVMSQFKDSKNNVDLISADINDATNAYYPNKEDKEAFTVARNSISGSESIVGSKGFTITADNFHYSCLGLFVIKPYLDFVPSTGMKMKCTRWTASQEFTIMGVEELTYQETVKVDGIDQILNRHHYTILTKEAPYLYSNDLYSFTKIEFFNGDTLVGKLEPKANETADLIQWYGCVTTWSKDNIHTPSILDYIEVSGNYYMPKEGNIGAFYYVDIPTGVITETLTDEPTCIKIDANYDSGTKQSYIDAKELLKNSNAPADVINSVSDTCLKANYNPENDYLTLSLKRNINKGWGLGQEPIFSEASCIRFTDRPDLGNIVVGAGFNNVNGKQNKAIFDYGFTSGKNNISIGRYAVAQGTRNASVYGGIALGNHNTVLGQNGFTAGATNYIDSDGADSIVAGRENTSLAHCGIALGRRNTIYSIYGVGVGYGNNIKGKGAFAGGYGNTISAEYSIALGAFNIVSGNNSSAIGRFNQVLATNSFASGWGNTNKASESAIFGLNLTINNSTASGIYGNSGHLLVGNGSNIIGGRNLIVGGQSNRVALHDSIIVGNNLTEESKGFGKAIFGNYNTTSSASIVLGAGYKDNSTGNIVRRNAFEVYPNGAVMTPFATTYSSTDTKRLTTKEYVDSAIATAAVLVSPNGTKYKISVNDDGSLITNKIDN